MTLTFLSRPHQRRGRYTDASLYALSITNITSHATVILPRPLHDYTNSSSKCHTLIANMLTVYFFTYIPSALLLNLRLGMPFSFMPLTHRFPKTYPTLACPIFTVQKPISGLTDNHISRLNSAIRVEATNNKGSEMVFQVRRPSSNTQSQPQFTD
jgi:hypothetical protein